MIELAGAATVAALISNAVGAFDKIYRGYADFIKKEKPTAMDVPPPDFQFVDSPDKKALVASSRQTGHVYQTVTYDELHNKLSKNDLEYLETLTSAMESYQRQWNSAYRQRAMASGMEIGKLDSQLEYLAKEISDPLIKILDFVQKLGLYLDDHYVIARMLAQDYLKEHAG